MSRGQTWAGLVWVPANSSVLLQPAPNEGVELTTILTYGDGSTAYGWGGLYTDTAGTGALFFWRGSGIGEGDLSEQCNIDLNVFIDEDVQCEILNADATSRYIGFTGITMTADRIRSDVLPTSAATWVSIQPPVGEDWLITTLASWSDNGSGGEAQMYDGTNAASYLFAPAHGIGYESAGVNNIDHMRVFINNDVYMRLRNGDTVAQNLGYSGIRGIRDI